MNSSSLIARRAETRIVDALARQAAVVLLGPRQVGKTTLARQFAEKRPSVYLDLEDPGDVAKLADPGTFLPAQAGRLVVIDEVHRAPALFPYLRSLIDANRRKGLRTGQFLLLGSASLDLLKQAGETLAGRVAHVDMGSLDAIEIGDGLETLSSLWLRGGFPDSFLASSDQTSFTWRRDLVRTYLEREVPMFGGRIPAETLRRLWTMLAHNQSQLFNASQLAQSLGVSPPTIDRYVDLLVDFFLVRRLQPLHANVGKRLVKSPRLIIRDSGLAHALLGIATMDDLAGHPVRGPSFEAMAIENLVAAAPADSLASFYRTAAGAEMDLVIDHDGRRYAFEIKATTAPAPTKGFHIAREDLKPHRTIVVHLGQDAYPMSDGVEAMGLRDAMLATLRISMEA